MKEPSPELPSIANLKDVDKAPQKRQNDPSMMAENYKTHSLLDTSKIKFESIISDGILHNQLLYATSYDKILRVISSDLVLLKDHEFNNTLESIIPLSENQLVIAVSKQISISQITDDHTHEIK